MLLFPNLIPCNLYLPLSIMIYFIYSIFGPPLLIWPSTSHSKRFSLSYRSRVDVLYFVLSKFYSTYVKVFVFPLFCSILFRLLFFCPFSLEYFLIKPYFKWLPLYSYEYITTLQTYIFRSFFLKIVRSHYL